MKTPKAIIVSGLQRSGSTWLFNVAREVAKLATVDFFSCYSDALKSELITKAQNSALLIVKAHTPARELCDFIQSSPGIFFATYRDPRDCVASLMTQFKLGFDEALASVTRTSNWFIQLDKSYKPFLLCYEKKFTQDPLTIRLVADKMGYPISDLDIDTIYKTLSPESIASLITLRDENGHFTDARPDKQYDRETHWHPNHLGDGSVGKYQTVLTLAQQRRILQQNVPFYLRYYAPADQ